MTTTIPSNVREILVGCSDLGCFNTLCTTLEPSAGKRLTYTQVCYLFGQVQEECRRANNGISDADILRVVDVIITDETIAESLKRFLVPPESY